MKQPLLFIGKITLHILAVVTIGLLFYPLAKWYFEASPVWGVDFFYTASMVNLLKQGFTLPPFAWFYAWFSGWPWVSSFPILHAYFIVPLVMFFGLTSAVKIWMLIMLGLYFAGIYAVCYRLSKNIAIGVILAAAAIYSVGVYGTLMWGGSLPNHATQAFYPWSIFFLISYFEKRNISHLLVSALIAGAAIWGHPQIVISYIYPTSLILSIFWVKNWKLIQRIKALAIFVMISFIIGFPILRLSFGDATKSLIITNSSEVASSTVRIDSDGARDIEAFHRSQPRRIIIDTNTTIFVVLGFAAVSWFITLILLRKREDFSKAFLPFIMLTCFYIAYVTMFAFGISIYHGGWYRLFWASPFWIGALVAVLWGQVQTAWQQKLPRILFMSINAMLSLIIFIGGIASILYFSSDIRDKIAIRSVPSSAYPDIVSLRADKTFAALSAKMVPAWLDPEQKNYRFYTGDQTVNIWWNTLYSMPLSRGYLDPPVSPLNRGYFFWLDASLSQSGKGGDQLVDSFNYPPGVAFQNTLFLIDWYSVKFAEAGHAGPTVYAPLPKSLTQEQYIKHEEMLDYNYEKYNTGNMALQFYEFSDNLVNPILSATNAPTLGVFASDQGFETVVRALADAGMGSTRVIPLKLGKQIESFTDEDAKKIDALLLYDYDYTKKIRAYSIIEKFLKLGKHVFIDTGFEVKEAESSSLPEIYPISQTTRKQMGKEWNLEITDDNYKDIDLSVFDPPVFDNTEWNLSYPESDSFVKSDANVILKNKGKPIVASRKTGTGMLYWSGVNLPYHVIRFHNAEEAKFFRKILEKMLPPAQNTAVFKSEFVSPEKRQISFEQATGILFKEQAYPGWSATIQNSKRKEKINFYKAGPAYPGFIYVAVPKQYQNKSTITLQYNGDPVNILLTGISILITIFILDSALTQSFFFGWTTRLYNKFMGRHLRVWWSKEDE